MQLSSSVFLQETLFALKNIYGERLAKVILFGSYSRGEQTSESDLDLLVVLKDEQLSAGREIRQMNDSLFDIGLRHGTPISAHPVTAKRFETESSFFFARVKREGKEL